MKSKRGFETAYLKSNSVRDYPCFKSLQYSMIIESKIRKPQKHPSAS